MNFKFGMHGINDISRHYTKVVIVKVAAFCLQKVAKDRSLFLQVIFSFSRMTKKE